MELLTQGELLKLVLMSLLSGMILGTVYDLFKVLRIIRETEISSRGKGSGSYNIKIDPKKNPIKNKKMGFGRVLKWTGYILCFFEDLLFFIIVSAMGVILFSAYGGGRVRLEGIALLFMAFIAWEMSVGKAVRPVTLFLKGIVIKICRYLYKKTLYPIKKRINVRMKKAQAVRLERQITSYSKKEKAKIKKKFGVLDTDGKGEKTKNGKKQ